MWEEGRAVVRVRAVVVRRTALETCIVVLGAGLRGREVMCVTCKGCQL